MTILDFVVHFKSGTWCTKSTNSYGLKGCFNRSGKGNYYGHVVLAMPFCSVTTAVFIAFGFFKAFLSFLKCKI